MTKSDDSDLVLTDHLYLHFLELPNLKETKDLSPLEKWLYYFKHEGEMNKMELVIKDDPVIEKAHKEYVRFTQDEKLRDAYEAQLRLQRDHATDIEEAITEREREIVKEMLAEKLDKKLIQKVTGLTIEEIENLERS